MDILLSKVTQQAMNYAIRSGIVITSSYAMKQCSRLIKSVDNSTEKQELADLQLRLESKIRIISPAIDMIELISARGNTSLESAVILTKSLRWDIQSLGVRLAKAAGEEELQRRGSSRAKPKADNELEVKFIISDIKKLLARIEDAVPLINLAITTSGANLSSSLPSTVSPSRLLQASTFLTAGDTQYSMNPTGAQQIGPAFTLSMYMLFAGHIRPQDEEGIRDTTWKEVIHKARVKLMRVPLDSIQDFTPSNSSHAHGSIPAAEGKAYEFAYQLLIIEDLDDDRVHTFEEGELQPGPFEDVARAGIREIIPIHQVSKIFYADTGKILNIGTDGETNNPILLLKRDVNAIPPRRMMERQTAEHWYDDYEEEESQDVREESAPAAPTEDDQSEVDAQLFRESSRAPEPEPQHGTEHYDDETTQPWRLPPNLDPEWVAFEVYVEESDSEDEDDTTEPTQPPSSTSPPGATPSSRSASLDPRLTTGLTNLNLRTLSPAPYHSSPPVPGTALQTRPTYSSPAPTFSPPPAPTSLPAIRTSLSLLEMLVRLTALQQFQQSSHLAIPDELLTFFLSESASTVGAGSDADLRRRVRRDAVRRVGFDPYDESPIKRRGEEYLEREMHAGGSQYDGEEREGTPYALQEGGEGDDRYYDDSSAEQQYQQQQRYYREDSSPTVRHLDASRHPQPHLHHPHRRVEAGARAAFANSTGSGSGGNSSSSPLRDRQYYASSSPLLPTHRDVPIPSREMSAQPSPLLRKATDRGGSGGGNGGGRLSVGERRRQSRHETPREER
ncbi:Ran-specific GTPase-activating protein 30 [Lasiodiplodia theobromae]|uniref:Ran-specific GTPase-activating protein 30 n=1 Tax=Lasiodiplodia theobromae TaxID=45133 RepID=A0A5N5D0Q1_9PEZI|nr:Ran-specific GTPase-activating protein 30 [Lasiodiplodia theobromae]